MTERSNCITVDNLGINNNFNIDTALIISDSPLVKSFFVPLTCFNKIGKDDVISYKNLSHTIL